MFYKLYTNLPSQKFINLSEIYFGNFKENPDRETVNTVYSIKYYRKTGNTVYSIKYYWTLYGLHLMNL